MNTALAAQQTSMTEQSLILPNKREALLMRLSEFKTTTLSEIEQKDWEKLTKRSVDLFVRLCWSKLSVSLKQLKKLEQQNLNELAVMVHQQSRTTALVHTGILACIPIIGWLTLLYLVDVEMSENSCWKNLRYYWWYKRIKNKYHQNFEPSF